VIWTSTDDRALFSIAESKPNLTHAQVAVLFTQTPGLPTSEDAVRNRLKRIKADIESNEMARVVSAESRIELPTIPRNAYIGPRICYYDIEATSLQGNVGRLLCCSFADAWGNVKTLRYTDFPGKTIIDDGPLAVAIRDELEKWDIWTGWNNRLYDNPFINGRLLKAGERPLRKDKIVLDLMYFARGQFSRIGSSRLQSVSEFFRTETTKFPLSFDTWALAGAGDEVALDEVVSHCQADVLVTRQVYAHLGAHVTIMHR